jgi:hypothetical protein
MLSSKSEFVQKNEIDTNLANSSPVNCVDLSRNVLEEKRKLEKTISEMMKTCRSSDLRSNALKAKQWFARAAWRSGHRIRLTNRRPGFESRPSIRFLTLTLQCCCVKLTLYVLVVCLLEK